MPYEDTRKFIALIDADDTDNVISWICEDQLWLKTFFAIYNNRYISILKSKYEENFNELELKRAKQKIMFYRILPYVDVNKRTTSFPFVFMYAIIEECHEFMVAVIKDPRHDCRIMNNYNHRGENLLDMLMSFDTFFVSRDIVEDVIEFLMEKARIKTIITPLNCFVAATRRINTELLKKMLRVCKWNQNYGEYNYSLNTALTDLVRCVADQDMGPARRHTTIEHALLVVKHSKLHPVYQPMLLRLQKDENVLRLLNKFEILALEINSPI